LFLNFSAKLIENLDIRKENYARIWDMTQINVSKTLFFVIFESNL